MDDPLILVGTSDGIRALGSDLPTMPAGKRVDHVVATGSGVWAIIDGSTLWFDPGAGPGSPLAQLDGARANCVMVAGERTMVGASEASLFELADGALRRLESFDATPGRDDWYTPWGGPPDVRSMAAGAGGELYVSVHVGGVVRSTDGGNSWVDTMDIHADVHEVIADPAHPGSAFAATARGLAETTDAGAEWTFSTHGLHAPYCRAVAVTEDHVFLSASAGSSGRQAALYRRRREGGAFEKCGAGLPEWFSTNLNTFCLAADHGLVVAGDEDGTVFRSTDQGTTWGIAAQGLPGVRCLAIVTR